MTRHEEEAQPKPIRRIPNKLASAALNRMSECYTSSDTRKPGCLPALSRVLVLEKGSASIRKQWDPNFNQLPPGIMMWTEAGPHAFNKLKCYNQPRPASTFAPPSHSLDGMF